MTDSEQLDIKAIRKAFEEHREAWNHNHKTGVEDVRFARLAEQWPEDVAKKRQQDGRPMLTLNKFPSFMRQVVNDARQAKPSIKVHPVDSGADVKTADVINGLIRNIEQVSNADVAYDTATECAVGNGFGFFRVSIDYAREDSFDLDIFIRRIVNPFSIFGDPHSTEADSSDWNTCFVIDRRSRQEFEREYKGVAIVDFDHDAWGEVGEDWLSEKSVTIAEYWHRREVVRELALLQDGRVVFADEVTPEMQAVTPVVDTRAAKVHEVKQYICTGAEIIEVNDWAGKYIPIIPVYGDEFDVEGKRYFRSLIHDAKDAGRMNNYWRTASTELIALAPRVPFIGEEGAFDADVDRWNTANVENHPYLEYTRGMPPPQRQPLDAGVAVGAMQEALSAMDDMKDIMGIHDASRGARSNETSGRAILARQREGDVATFHFQDNMSRAIRHCGRILLDLIPKVYTKERVVRVLGEDGQAETFKINAEYEGQDENGQAYMAMHDLTVGKYDLTVSSGPSFTTRREEAATQMTELVRAFPQAAPFIADIMARNFDWPGADEIAKRFAKMVPGGEGLPPEVQEIIQQGRAEIERLVAEVEKLKNDMTIEHQKVEIDRFEAETDRLKVAGELQSREDATAERLNGV